ncbi:uncharacterized protein [Mytilus edulis]|uniref:uncharacterized protein n=1 Tax=Mytilus edulis TaxID=6550 RepID=UPI0039F04FD6
METDKDICRRLYHCLCETISEEVVKIRRQFYASVDHFAERKEITLISSGSRAEGLDMRSDIDLMCLLNFVNVSEERTEDSFLIPNNFVMEIDDCKPCFTQLKGNSCHYNWLTRWFSTPLGQGLSLESGRVRYLFLSIIRLFKPMNLHGPCASNGDGLCDVTISLRCPVWIKQAQPWIKRVRYWPPKRVVSCICSYGILFVPIGSKESPNEHLEWRISFSVAEKHLIFSFTHTQLLCYALLKLMLKQVIEEEEKFKGLLCSYFIKTIIFWVSEEFDSSLWRPDNMLPCFMNCFKRLIYCITYKCLPHYFIIENNLFECRFNRQQHQDFLIFLNDLYSKGIYCFLNCNVLLKFFNNAPIISKTSDIEIVCRKLNAISVQYARPYLRLLGMFNLVDTPSRQLKRGQLFIKRFFNIKHNDFLPFIIFVRFCQLVGKSMDINANYPNKYRYKLSKQYLPFFFLGLHGDAVSGWMYVATYYYCIGQYTTSLKLIIHALKQYAPDKILARGSKLSTHQLSVIEKEGIRRKIWKSRHFYKRHVINEIYFYYDSRVIPRELDVQATTQAYIPPIVYIHFLRFLCFYRLHEDSMCMHAIRDLRISVIRKHPQNDRHSVGEAYHCLAVALLIVGQKKEARFYFALSTAKKSTLKDIYF